MSARRRPFASVGREAEREQRRAVMARPAHLRDLSSKEYVRAVARAALEGLRADQAARDEEQRLEPWPAELAGLSDEASGVLGALRRLGDVALAGDLTALLGDQELVDRGLGELIRWGLVEAKTTMGADGHAAAESLLRLRYDVELPGPTAEAT